MEMRKLHMGTISYGADAMDEVAHQLVVAFGAEQNLGRTTKRQGSLATGSQLAGRGRRDISSRVRDVVLALALCHNVSVDGRYFRRRLHPHSLQYRLPLLLMTMVL
jgi:phospholipid-translocating ATPase